MQEIIKYTLRGRHIVWPLLMVILSQKKFHLKRFILLFTFLAVTVIAATLLQTETASAHTTSKMISQSCGWTRVDDQPIFVPNTNGSDYQIGHTIMWHNTCSDIVHEQVIAFSYHSSMYGDIGNQLSGINQTTSAGSSNSGSYINTPDIGWTGGWMGGSGEIYRTTAQGDNGIAFTNG